MGNIEIRQQNSRIRRAPIFSERKSLTPSKYQVRKTSTSNNQKQLSRSPIRFSNKHNISYQNALTERKVNTARINSSQLEHNLTSRSRYLNKQENFEQNLTNSIRNKEINKIQRINTQNFDDQLINHLSLSGKIVPNSKRGNTQRIRFPEANQFSNRNKNEINNPLQNRQIIKKVRNFNDFLNQIKRKLKEDKMQTLQRKQNSSRSFGKSNENENNHRAFHTNRQFNEMQNDLTLSQIQLKKTMQKNKSTRRIEVALKLQNQKLQLEKYRKLVERQLSKNHSIENISLCTKNSGQKILTIQYESILPQYLLSNQNSKPHLHRQNSEQTIISKVNQNNIEIVSNRFIKKIDPSKQVKQSQKNQKLSLKQLRRLKQQYQTTMKNMMQLGQKIGRYQNQLEKQIREQKKQDNILIRQQFEIDAQNNDQKQNSKRFKQKQRINDGSQSKIEKIQNLFERLSVLQQKYRETDQQIREAIQFSHQTSNILDESQT